jgi:hypothetical protein
MAALPENQRTVTWDEMYNAWTSFHSYVPEWMERLGTKFYTFKNGELYEHESNETRTNFYGTTYGCRVEFSANEGPSDVKVFKALGLESNSSDWYATLNSEMESGAIGASGNLKFQEKEAMQYAYIRRQSTDKNNYNKLSVLGLGNIVTSGGGTTIVMGDTIPNQVAVGDECWFDNGGGAQQFGVISAIDGVNLTVNAIINPPSGGDFAFIVKDPEVESYGLRGYHAKVILENDSTGFVELYAVNSEVFKSYM